jgi:hypothetical protein
MPPSEPNKDTPSGQQASDDSSATPTQEVIASTEGGRRKWVGAFSQGSEVVPPLNAKEKELLGEEEIVLLLSGFNNYGDKIYNYLKIPLKNVDLIIKSAESGGRFDVGNFGEVIAAGLGTPPEDVREEIERQYKMLSFPASGEKIEGESGVTEGAQGRDAAGASASKKETPNPNASNASRTKEDGALKMFLIPCEVNGVKVPVQFYIGEPTPSLSNPIHFQTAWIKQERGVDVPEETLDSLAKLKSAAAEKNVSFVDLCQYALNYPK